MRTQDEAEKMLRELQAYLESKPKGYEIKDWPPELPAPEGWELLHYASNEGGNLISGCSITKSLIRKL